MRHSYLLQAVGSSPISLSVQGKKNREFSLQTLATVIKGNLWLQGAFPLRFDLARRASRKEKKRKEKRNYSSTSPAVLIICR